MSVSLNSVNFAPLNADCVPITESPDDPFKLPVYLQSTIRRIENKRKAFDRNPKSISPSPVSQCAGMKPPPPFDGAGSRKEGGSLPFEADELSIASDTTVESLVPRQSSATICSVDEVNDHQCFSGLKSLVVIDWDDTIFPTSYCNRLAAQFSYDSVLSDVIYADDDDGTRCSVEGELPRMSPMDQALLFLSERLVTYDTFLLSLFYSIRVSRDVGVNDVRIVTNAEVPWVHLSCARVFPQLYQFLVSESSRFDGVRILSARSQYSHIVREVESRTKCATMLDPSLISSDEQIFQKIKTPNSCSDLQFSKNSKISLGSFQDQAHTPTPPSHVQMTAWKECAFRDLVFGHPEEPPIGQRKHTCRYNQVVSIGDSCQERSALLSLLSINPLLLVKSFKFVEKSSPDLLYDQFMLLNRCLTEFLRFDGPLDVCVNIGGVD